MKKIKKKSSYWMTLLAWFLTIPYNLMLLFSPLAILHFIFEMKSENATIVGLIFGIIMCLSAGLTPKTGEDSAKSQIKKEEK